MCRTKKWSLYKLVVGIEICIGLKYSHYRVVFQIIKLKDLYHGREHIKLINYIVHKHYELYAISLSIFAYFLFYNECTIKVLTFWGLIFKLITCAVLMTIVWNLKLLVARTVLSRLGNSFSCRKFSLLSLSLYFCYFDPLSDCPYAWLCNIADYMFFE